MIQVAERSERFDQSNSELLESPVGFAVFDIETGPLSDEQLRMLCPPFVAPSPLGEFDPAAVKIGNLKDKQKIAEKITGALSSHLTACERYESDLIAGTAEHFDTFKSKAALSAATGQVVAIGLLPPGDRGLWLMDCDGTNEEAGLQNFWNWVQYMLQGVEPIIGFNIHAFDLPFLVRRSWILGVPVPLGVRQGRYWNPLFIDLMKAWALDSREMISLDNLAAAFGLPGKVTEVDGVPVDGATFYQVWRENRAVAEAYLRQDLALPAELARRMGVV